MPVQLMHAGEEVLWVMIPIFVILMLVDLAKKRKLRREKSQKKDGKDPSE
ncbi:MAG: hypothetical protein ACR2FO_03010 [Actinomycetota bacterium]